MRRRNTSMKFLMWWWQPLGDVIGCLNWLMRHLDVDEQYVKEGCCWVCLVRTRGGLVTRVKACRRQVSKHFRN